MRRTVFVKSARRRIEVNEGPGSGVRILNKPVPAALRESVAYAEQNLYARAAQLVGDKGPRQHEFSVQLRAFDASKSGAKLGVAILVALCTALLKKTTRGGLILIRWLWGTSSGLSSARVPPTRTSSGRSSRHVTYPVILDGRADAFKFWNDGSYDDGIATAKHVADALGVEVVDRSDETIIKMSWW